MTATFWFRLHKAFLWLAVDYNGKSRFPHDRIHQLLVRRWWKEPSDV